MKTPSSSSADHVADQRAESALARVCGMGRHLAPQQPGWLSQTVVSRAQPGALQRVPYRLLAVNRGGEQVRDGSDPRVVRPAKVQVVERDHGLAHLQPARKLVVEATIEMLNALVIPGLDEHHRKAKAIGAGRSPIPSWTP